MSSLSICDGVAGGEVWRGGVCITGASSSINCKEDFAALTLIGSESAVSVRIACGFNASSDFCTSLILINNSAEKDAPEGYSSIQSAKTFSQLLALLKLHQVEDS